MRTLILSLILMATNLFAGDPLCVYFSVDAAKEPSKEVDKTDGQVMEEDFRKDAGVHAPKVFSYEPACTNIAGEAYSKNVFSTDQQIDYSKVKETLIAAIKAKLIDPDKFIIAFGKPENIEKANGLFPIIPPDEPKEEVVTP